MEMENNSQTSCALGRKPPGSHSSFADLAADYQLLIPATRITKWRLLFPNVGQLDGFPHFGDVMIMATDGLEAYYHVDNSGFLWKGHLKAFTGPVAKVYVWEQDWDYEKKKRKVRVFRRFDGTYAIIPQDSFWEQYWEKRSRIPRWEHELYEKLLVLDGHVIRRGQVTLDQLNASIVEMSARASIPTVSRKRELTARQKLLATL